MKVTFPLSLFVHKELRTARWQHVVMIAIAIAYAPMHIAAQQNTPSVLPPAITQSRTSESAQVPYTAAEWNHGLTLFNMQARADQPPDVVVFPKDSIRAAVSAKVQAWLNTLESRRTQGIQMDPHGNLLVAADQDNAARQEFAKRLASPDMTLPDRAFTLLTAVQAFADPDRPERFAAAEEYMAKLDALSDDAAYWQYFAHQTLSLQYYLAGQRQGAVAHGQKVVDRLSKMWFGSRKTFYQSPAAQNVYLSMVDVLFDEPNGLEQIKNLNERIVAATRTPPELFSDPTDSTFLWKGQGYERGFQFWARLAAMYGQPAPSVYGHRWLNRENTGEHEEPLNDGKIRIVGLGTQGSSLFILAAFQRLQQQFSSERRFEPLYVAETNGYWGTTFMSPQEETEQITQYFMQRRPTQVPIAIWAGEKQVDAEGGMRPQRSPTVLGFRATRRPTVYIVDGKGIIRRVFARFSREDEEQAVAMIKYLLSEEEE